MHVLIPPIRILVVDDHTLFRRGLIALLGRDPLLSVAGDAADAGQAIRKAQELQPDLILLDIHLPGVNGVDALPGLRQAAPGACILMLTVSEDEDDLARALQGGASGYLLKTMEGDDLTAAILRAMQGDSVIAPEMMSKLVAAYRSATKDDARNSIQTANAPASCPAIQGAQSLVASLSPRELEILRGIARGESNKKIARDHGIAETTVKIHVQHILRKLDVSSRVHAAVIATEQGLL
ncbi:MAG: response regulator [Rhodoferax sp.]|jgi:two-component system nitrate/nitrite response regulator NarL|nr:response regulator [Rhodoferax sp.]